MIIKNYGFGLIGILLILLFTSFSSLVYSQTANSGLVLIGFNSSQDLKDLILDESVSASITNQFVTEGDSALLLNFSQINGLPGASLYIDSLSNKVYDWSNYGIFALDITNTSSQQNQIGILIQDQNNAVFYQLINLSSQKTTTIKFEINQLKTKLDISKIEMIRFFMNHPQQTVSYVIDNIRLSPVDLNLNILEPVYNHAFYSTYNEPWLKANLTVTPYPPAGYNAIGKVISKNGAVLDSETITTLKDSNNIEFPSSIIQFGDTVTLSLSVYDKQGSFVDEASVQTEKYPPGSNEVVIRDDGVTLVNGKPFFPIGIFQSPETDLDTIKNFGFNTAQSYLFTWSSYMQKASDLGLMVLPTMPAGLFHNSPSFNSSNYAFYVNAIKNYSSLLGYYYFDEPSQQYISWEIMKYVDDFSESVDPYHPATGVNNNDQSYYAGSSDIMMIDAYPFNYPSQGFPWIIDRLKAGITSMKGKGPVWFVPQAFPWQPYFWYGDFPNGKYDSSLSRPPTYNELRSETWLGITMGVQGIIYYSYAVQNLNVKDAYPVMWKALNFVVKELDRLQDVLTSEEVSPSFKSNDTTIYINSKSYNGEDYFFAVNPTKSTKFIQFQVPQNITNLNVISEGRTISVNGGYFTDTLGAYETNLYTTSNNYNNLPDKDYIDSVLSNMPTHFLYSDLLDVAKGAKLVSSWGFSTSDSYWPWYRMIDANEYTPWLLDHDNQGDWIEVDLPKVESIKTITVVSGNVDWDIQVFNNGSWQSEPITETGSAGYLHFSYKGNYQTAIFPAVSTDKIRIVIKNSNIGAKPVFEIEAFSNEVHPTSVGSNENGIIPQKFELFQNYPNPFNNATTISYNLPKKEKVDLLVFDILGRKIARLVDQEQSPGKHSVYFNADNFSSGIYIYKLTAGNYTDEKKLVLLK